MLYIGIFVTQLEVLLESLNRSNAKCSGFVAIRIQNEECKMQSYNAKFKMKDTAATIRFQSSFEF